MTKKNIPTKSSEKAFSIMMMGNAMFDRDVGRHLLNKPDDFKLSKLKQLFKQYDVIFFNLESPISR